MACATIAAQAAPLASLAFAATVLSTATTSARYSSLVSFSMLEPPL